MNKTAFIVIATFSIAILLLNTFLILLQNLKKQNNQNPVITETLKTAKELNVLGETTKNKEIEKEIAYWQEFTNKNPNYRDAFMKLAILNYKEDNTEEAQKNLKKVLDLDPNYSPALELQKELEK